MSTTEFALIRAQRVESVIVADQQFADEIAPDWDAVVIVSPHQKDLGVGPGWGWVDNAFEPPAMEVDPTTGTASGLSIEITRITADAEHTEHLMLKGLQEVTCTVGTVLEAEAELRLQGQVLPLDDVFRMPMRSRDGRERVLLGRMTQGRIAFRVSLPESGVWRVTEAGINEAVPAEQRMAFAGLTIYVVEA